MLGFIITRPIYMKNRRGFFINNSRKKINFDEIYIWKQNLKGGKADEA